MYKVKRYSIEDADLVNAILRDESIYPWISDDGCPPSDQFSSDKFLLASNYYFLAPDLNSLFIYNPVNCITWEIHFNVLPSSRGFSTKLTKATLNYMFTETECQKVVTHIPLFNMAAFNLSIASGFRVEGCSCKSFLKHGILYDQYLMGLTKEDFKCLGYHMQ